MGWGWAVKGLLLQLVQGKMVEEAEAVEIIFIFSFWLTSKIILLTCGFGGGVPY